MLGSWIVGGCLGLALATPAWAAPADPMPEAPPAPTADPGDLLDQAGDLVRIGMHDEARSLLTRILQRAADLDDVPFAVEAEAWIYLGEIQLEAGEDRLAEKSFEQVLRRDRDYRLSDRLHGEKTIARFNIVRSNLPPLDRTIRPMPWWGYAPFGVPQFKQRRPVRGTVYASLQIGAAVTSVAAWVIIDQTVASYAGKVPGALEDEAQARREQAILLRNALSITSASAFYVTWGISVIDAGVAWRGDQLAPPSVVVVPREDGVAIAVSGRF